VGWGATALTHVALYNDPCVCGLFLVGFWSIPVQMGKKVKSKPGSQATVYRDCPKCGKKEQPFYGSTASYCKNCAREYQRVQWHVRKWKPILLKKQKGRCAICRRDLRKLPSGQHHVDHLHETGFVRGLLCKPCNNMLGNARDSVEVLREAADYLERTGGGVNPADW
jgi:hypothetical protein